MLMPIALTAAGAAALMLVWLSLRVVLVRRAANVELGDGGSEPLTRRIRAHGNFVENAPFFLLLVALLELNGAGERVLWAATIAFFLVRLAHVFGMDRKAPNALRIVGAVGTWTVLLLLGGWAIYLTYSQTASVTQRQPTEAALKI
jgi:uncharacterized membrane protein YecN with MAPEG domain